MGKRYDPFTLDGVQTVIMSAPSHSDHYITGSRADVMRREVQVTGETWARFENSIKALWFGFDPLIRDQYGKVVGQDSYPNAEGHWDFDLEEFIWEAV